MQLFGDWTTLPSVRDARRPHQRGLVPVVNRRPARRETRRATTTRSRSTDSSPAPYAGQPGNSHCRRGHDRHGARSRGTRSNRSGLPRSEDRAALAERAAQRTRHFMSAVGEARVVTRRASWRARLVAGGASRRALIGGPWCCARPNGLAHRAADAGWLGPFRVQPARRGWWQQPRKGRALPRGHDRPTTRLPPPARPTSAGTGSSAKRSALGALLSIEAPAAAYAIAEAPRHIRATIRISSLRPSRRQAAALIVIGMHSGRSRSPGLWATRRSARA